MRFLVLTMDGTHGAALRKATALVAENHGVTIQLQLYNATSLRTDEDWKRLAADAAQADFIFGARLFGEDFVRPLTAALAEASCPIGIIISNPVLIRHTRLGKFVLQQRDENEKPSVVREWIGKLRPKGGAGEIQRQMSLLRNVGKILKHIPGKSRDLHTYIALHQYWTHSSAENLARMLCLLVERYVPGYRGKLPVQDALLYPDVALIHPDAPEPFTDLASYAQWRRKRDKTLPSESRSPDQGCVGLLSLRTVALGGNTAHLDALARALEARGIEVRTFYGSGLDFRPALEHFCLPASQNGNSNDSRRRTTKKQHEAQPAIDLLINGTGFSLVGGPAESRPEEARTILEALDVSYVNMFPLTMQRVDEWQRDDSGLIPIHLTMNMAIPELDSAVEPMVIGGPTPEGDAFVPLDDQIELAARRIARRVRLHRLPNADKKVGLVIFNFPPSLGNIGTAAYLDVFASLHRLLRELQAEGYTVEVPESVDELRRTVVEGNAMVHGTDANVGAYLPVSDYLRLFPAAREIEPVWGRAPGDMLNDGKRFFILGAQFGNVFVGIQPGFGYERDPMRLLMAKDAAPHHGFAAFYTWLEHCFQADALVHMGTHGALEFMPGKQAGLSTDCWPTRLLGSLPNIYYYSANNPSEATIARRRSAATLVSYMVPPLQQAGLYKGLRLLKDDLDRYHQQPSPELLEHIRAQAERLGINVAQQQNSQNLCESSTESVLEQDSEFDVAALAHELIQVEQRMIPVGLHVLGESHRGEALADILALVTTFLPPVPDQSPLPRLVAQGMGLDYDALRNSLKHEQAAQQHWEQIDAVCRAAVRMFVEDDFPEISTASQPIHLHEPGHNGHRAILCPSLLDGTCEHCEQPDGKSQAECYLGQTAELTSDVLAPLWDFLKDLSQRIVHDHEIEGLLRALRGGYVPASPGSDIVRNPAVVPTGRNIYGLDPYNVPSLVAQESGQYIAREMLTRLTHEQGALPETVAIVLWGIDNLKSGGEGIGQVLALLGARAVADELGKTSGVELIPLDELGRPRVDVVVTVSGIFRDLLHHQMILLDKAVHLAATADEPLEQNFVRKHALAQAKELDISLEEAATRIFANAPGSYGANVNHLVDSGTWDDEQQLSETFLNRKSFSFQVSSGGGQWRDSRTIMERALSSVDATFQNIDSFEVGISDIDYYYESLGGVTKSVERLRGKRPPVLVADAVSSTERLSSLEQMVRLETRAKLLNPRWFEGMLAHGSEGVREIEARVSNTYGWSVTTDSVEGWAYQGVAETFLLDQEMRERLARLNPHAVAGMTRRLLEASSRGFWQADEDTLAALYDVYDDLEDQLEGISIAQSA